MKTRFFLNSDLSKEWKKHMTATSYTRRYDLDWLRVIAFALLIFYHVGMFYVSWDWHVKSQYASTSAEWLMELLNPWRLALLFFISGVALRFAADKMSLSSLLGRRIYRLGLPMVFGMAVIVMPQSYFQMRQAGLIEQGMLHYWQHIYLNFNDPLPLTTPTWNHLWYVIYLLVYSLILTPIYALLKHFSTRINLPSIHQQPIILGLSLLVIIPLPFILFSIFLDPLFPTTHALSDDWANHAHRFTIFLIGFSVAKSSLFWRAISRSWKFWGVGVLALVIWANAMIEGLIPTPSFMSDNLEDSLEVYYAWGVIVTLLGAAQHYLNKPSTILTYLNQAIFPYFILHQTLIISAGYILTQLNLGIWAEFAGVLVITTAGCLLLERIIRYIKPIRPLFGLN